MIRIASCAGYRIVEHTLAPDSAAVGRILGELNWPAGHLPVTVLHDRRLVDADAAIRLTAGDRINILVPTVGSGHVDREPMPTGHPD